MQGMSYTYDQLKGMTVAQLREIAHGIEHDAVKGYTQLNKEHLLIALAKALNLDTHTRHKLGDIDKAGVKAQMHALKKERDAALDAHDHTRLKKVRRDLHALRRSLRRSAASTKKHQSSGH
jgi:hypothetical protein